MRKALVVFAVAVALAGCSTARERVVVLSPPTAVVVQPQPVARRVEPPRSRDDMDSMAALRPGRGYVAAFPEADRRAACDRLEYRPGTRAYSRCLQGDFPENPYFASAGNRRSR